MFAIQNSNRFLKNLRDLSISLDNSIAKCLFVNEKMKHLFVGTDRGSIYAIKLSSFDNSINEHLSICNVHQRTIQQIHQLNSRLISIGDDGHIVIYQFNISQENQQVKTICREEILAEQILLKHQVERIDFCFLFRMKNFEE